MAAFLVVLSDFFAVSNRALSYAADLACLMPAELVLLHVAHDELLAPEQQEYQSLTRRTARSTAVALEQLAHQQPVATTVRVSEQQLPAAVQEAVREHHPLLLVLSQPGSGATPWKVVVDTATTLLLHAPHPLLVIPQVGWEQFPPRRLLLAVDGEPFELAGRSQVLRQLLAATAGTLSVVHVTDDGHALPNAQAVLATVRDQDVLDEVPDNCLRQVYHPNPTEGILREAAHQKADMLVLVARRHSFLGSLFHRSITADVVRESPIPVLLLPADD
ncbi:universal stress protein [Hymenobacter psychrophilus]|uniref:Nucleotide-binding universal stress protein, UspA family n=1 Tax=Hymenobacter psychrophilus TaxID=651662 RepID=A0A1H3K6I5_9BACT|nr:universal stress protein [Hymenobacter psychrophilus]SDY47781.1 Nucleotide-binding universal stress protein, UspA family [Hymenobacter psychrophilus]